MAPYPFKRQWFTSAEEDAGVAAAEEKGSRSPVDDNSLTIVQDWTEEEEKRLVRR